MNTNLKKEKRDFYFIVRGKKGNLKSKTLGIKYAKLLANKIVDDFAKITKISQLDFYNENEIIKAKKVLKKMLLLMRYIYNYMDNFCKDSSDCEELKICDVMFFAALVDFIQLSNTDRFLSLCRALLDKNILNQYMKAFDKYLGKIVKFDFQNLSSNGCKMRNEMLLRMRMFSPRCLSLRCHLTFLGSRTIHGASYIYDNRQPRTIEEIENSYKRFVIELN